MSGLETLSSSRHVDGRIPRSKELRAHGAVDDERAFAGVRNDARRRHGRDVGHARELARETPGNRSGDAFSPPASGPNRSIADGRRERRTCPPYGCPRKVARRRRSQEPWSPDGARHHRCSVLARRRSSGRGRGSRRSCATRPRCTSSRGRIEADRAVRRFARDLAGVAAARKLCTSSPSASPR